MQNGHLGKIMIRAVDKKDKNPFFFDGVLFNAATGFVLQHVVFSECISGQIATDIEIGLCNNDVKNTINSYIFDSKLTISQNSIPIIAYF